ncbi:hypothetical protein [Mycobacterium sp. 1081908.1]|nr:hypothetical protein [Mycobacterium sp. 1081908.1]
MDLVLVAGFVAIFVLWSLAIWLGHEARRRHLPRDGHRDSSDPSLI